MVILDTRLAEQLRADRAAAGVDRYDEVWEGAYMMAPTPDNEHEWLVSHLASILQDVIGEPGLGEVVPEVHVSDRRDGWNENYRVPDVAVFLNSTSAVNRGSYWQGGPDFAVDVVSPGDRSREKIGFYASVHTREFLVLDREPWQLELYRLSSGSLQLIALNRPNDFKHIQSDVVDLNFELRQDELDDCPSLIVTDAK
jgi:Uma2 family endonuclease